MKQRTGMFMFILGLLMTLGGVGGVENSMDTVSMLQSVAVAVVGLALMAVGVTGIKNKDQ